MVKTTNTTNLEKLEKELLELRATFLATVDELERIKASARLKELEYLQASGCSVSEGYFLEIGKDGVAIAQATPKAATAE